MLLSYAFKKLISACQENYFALKQAIPYISAIKHFYCGFQQL